MWAYRWGGKRLLRGCCARGWGCMRDCRWGGKHERVRGLRVGRQAGLRADGAAGGAACGAPGGATGWAASGAANCCGWDCMYGAVSGGCEGLRAGGTVCGSAGGAVSGAARGWSCVRGFGWGSKQAVMREGLHRLRHGRASGGTPTKSKCK